MTSTMAITMDEDEPTETAEAVDPVEQLTDTAITNERAKLGRMIHKRIETRAQLDTEIVDLQTRDTLLLTSQIKRLTRQLPAVKAVESGEEAE